jgi:hypothetical protein
VKRIALGHLSLEGIPQGRYHLLEKRQADLLRHPAPLRIPQPVSKFPRPSFPPSKSHAHPSRSARPHRHPTSPPKRKSPR